MLCVKKRAPEHLIVKSLLLLSISLPFFRTLHLSIVAMWCGVLVLVGTKNTLLNSFKSS